MTIQNHIKTAIALTAFALVFAAPVAADGTCTNQYGSTVDCPTSNIVINKKVAYPGNPNLFVENLTSHDAAYSPKDEVEYDVAVSNTSNVNFPTVTVIDVFPSQETFVSGPGTYEAASNKLTYEISNLTAGTTVHNRILVAVKDASVFPANQDITCNIVNTATATGPGGQSDQDTSSLCVQTKVLGATTLPVAGFEDNMIIMTFAAIGGMGTLLFIMGRKRLS